MRLRTDSAHVAGWKRVHELLGCDCTPEVLAESAKPAGSRVGIAHVVHEPEHAGVEGAQPGDVWRITDRPGNLLGYALACPNEACDQGVHFWTHARDCERESCAGCWAWSGSPEDGTLSATPSLWVAHGCGWHGFLTAGEMRSV